MKPAPVMLRAIGGFALLFAADLRGLIGSEPLATGEHLFRLHCAPCHGPGGEGARGPTLARPKLSRVANDDDLLRIIRRGVSGTEMPSSRLTAAQIAEVATFVRALGRRPAETLPGDAARGAELYTTKGGCAQCHTIAGRGGAVGPDLTEIGARRGAAYLRRALTEPGAEVPQSFSTYQQHAPIVDNFLQVRLVTRSGRSIFGVRVNEDTFSIQVRDLENRLHSFFKSELAEFHKDWGQSLMPSYRDALSPTELDDLVAFLATLQGLP